MSAKDFEPFRHRLKEYGDLFHGVAEILFRYNPNEYEPEACTIVPRPALMGISFKQSPTEYQPEACTIVPRLKECSSIADVRRMIREEFPRRFNGPRSDVAGNEARYDDPAREIWDLWTQFRAQTGQ